MCDPATTRTGRDLPVWPMRSQARPASSIFQRFCSTPITLSVLRTFSSPRRARLPRFSRSTIPPPPSPGRDRSRIGPSRTRPSGEKRGARASRSAAVSGCRRSSVLGRCQRLSKRYRSHGLPRGGCRGFNLRVQLPLSRGLWHEGDYPGSPQGPKLVGLDHPSGERLTERMDQPFPDARHSEEAPQG